MARATLTAWLMAFFGANVWRAVLGAQQAALPDLHTAVPLAYLAAMGAAWAAGFALLAVAVWRRAGRSARVTIIAMLLYLGQEWVHHLAFSRSSEAFATLGFRALLTGLALLITLALAWFYARGSAPAAPPPTSHTQPR